MRYTTHHSPLTRAFTMVEVLGVIAVIAIMAAILFPVFAQAREKARQAMCQSNLHQIGLALHAYARDYDGRLPPDDQDMKPLILPYVNHLGVFRCPSDGSASGITGQNAPNGPLNPGLIPVPAGPLVASYQYRGGLSLEARGDTPVAADWSFLHRGVADVLFLSGEVGGRTQADWVPFTRGPRPGGPGAPPTFPPGVRLPGRTPTPSSVDQNMTPVLPPAGGWKPLPPIPAGGNAPGLPLPMLPGFGGNGP